MRKVWMVTTLVLAAACGGDDGAGAPGVDFTCSAEDRTGTYLVRYTETSGTCGPLEDELGRLDAAEPVDGYGDCQLAGPDRWTDGECTLERSIECADGTRLVATTTQQDPDGEELRGTLGITLEGVCRSTYEVVSRRE